jgi:hypothetical protein
LSLNAGLRIGPGGSINITARAPQPCANTVPIPTVASQLVPTSSSSSSSIAPIIGAIIGVLAVLTIIILVIVLRRRSKRQSVQNPMLLIAPGFVI